MEDVLCPGPGRFVVVVLDIVGQDRHQVAVGEWFDGRCGAHCAAGRVDAVQFRQRVRLGDLSRTVTSSNAPNQGPPDDT
ncbi:hypothetical protein OG521_38930 [Streptomyces sp. NBC_01463]